MATFAERLRSLRTKKGLTQKEVADRLGISESAYGYYEQGRRQPPQESYAVLADLFDVSLDYLLLGKATARSASVSTEEAEFLQWVDENLEDAFFYDFHKSPEEQKKQFMETMKALWEVEKKRGNIKPKE